MRPLALVAVMAMGLLGGAYAPGLAGLVSQDMTEREKAYSAMAKERADTIKALMDLAGQQVTPKQLGSGKDILTENPYHDRKHLAILLLGELRAAEAVPVLMRNIDYVNPRAADGGYALGIPGGYPAVEALIRIGMPSVDAVVKQLRTYKEACEGRRLCCVVLRDILGYNLALARLQMALDQERDEGAKACLSAAATNLKEKMAEEKERGVYSDKPDEALLLRLNELGLGH